MKQRLLLALLVLFASVGMVKADDNSITLKIPKASGNVTVTMSGTFKDNSHPTVTETNNVKLTHNASQTTVTVKEDKTKEQNVTITVGNNNVTRINVSGKVTEFDASSVQKNGTFGKSMKELTFSGNGELTTLNLKKGNDCVFPELTALNCSGNKLAFVPGIKNFPDMKASGYNAGSQTPGTFIGITSDVTPNEGLDITIEKLLGNTSGYTSITDFTIKGWMVKGTDGKYTSTNYAYTYDSAPNRFYFFKNNTGDNAYQEGDEYMDGDFTCDVQFGPTSNYPGLVLKGIPVKVSPVEYQQKDLEPVISPKNSGSVTVLSGDAEISSFTSTIKKGDKFTLKPVAESGYAFSKFEYGKGLTELSNKEGLYEVQVNGKGKPSIKAIFTANGQKVSIQNASNGKITVFDGETEITDGGNVAMGKTIKIYATPNDGYQVNKVLVNGTKELTDDAKGYYEYKVEGAITITASFAPKTATTLTFKWIDGKIASIQVDGQDGTSTTDNNYKTKSYNVAFNTKPTIKITASKGSYLTPSSIVANSNSEVKPFTWKEVTAETNSNGPVYLISDFEMPKDPVTLVITTSEKSEAKIVVDAKNESSSFKYNESLVYFDDIKSIPYTTEPNNLSNVVVEYNTKDGAEAKWSKTGFKNAGTYKVRFSRAADKDWAAAKVVTKSNPSTEITNGIVEFTIAKSTPVVKSYPTITVNKEGKYEIKGGSVVMTSGNQEKSIASNKYVWTTDDTPEQAKDADGKVKAGKYNSKVVAVKLQLKDDANKTDITNNEDSNFEQNTTVNVKYSGEGTIADVALAVYSKLPQGTSLTFMNGAKVLGTSATVPAGTKISFDVKAEGFDGVKIIQVDDNGNKVGTEKYAPISASSGKKEATATGKKMIFTIEADNEPKNQNELVLVSAEDKKADGYDGHVYDGKVHKFNTTRIVVKQKDADGKISEIPSSSSIDWSNATITYKEDATGQVTTEPKNAGTYTITIVRPADALSKDNITYKEFKATGSMVIEQATPTIITLPNGESEPALIGKGEKLETSILTGGVANVEGKFDWVNPAQIVNVDGQYEIKFTSADKNYKDVVVDESGKVYKAYVKITNEAILSIVKDNTYSITAKGSDGKTYTSGMSVPVGTTLTFTVTPAATYKLKTLYVNGKAISGNSYKTTAGPISVKAEMTQEFTITVTKPSKGAIVTLPSITKVDKGGSYSFTVAALAADMGKIVVKDGANLVAGANGTYTISNITANKNITISLDNPTAITVVADTTMSPGKKPMGTITITGAPDGKCYYGDEVSVKASPVSGVSFAKWIGTTETSESFKFIAKEASYKFKAVYAGSPVGIETIEGVKVYGAKGNIVVKCNGEASVIVISMNGQSRKVEISGDTHIPAGAGIYGVVLMQGDAKVQTKVVVR